MNMIGAPKHVEKCIEAGVDIICAQGGEVKWIVYIWSENTLVSKVIVVAENVLTLTSAQGGGHTGEVATSILIPLVLIYSFANSSKAETYGLWSFASLSKILVVGLRFG